MLANGPEATASAACQMTSEFVISATRQSRVSIEGTLHHDNVPIVRKDTNIGNQESVTAAVGRSLPIFTTACAGQVECKRLVSGNANEWSSPCNYAALLRITLFSLLKHPKNKSRIESFLLRQEKKTYRFQRVGR
jgi:hypothetical protein